MGAFFKPSEEPGVKRAKRSGATLIPGSSHGTLCAAIAERMSTVARSLWRKTLSLSPSCGWVHFKLPKWVKSTLALTHDAFQVCQRSPTRFRTSKMMGNASMQTFEFSSPFPDLNKGRFGSGWDDLLAWLHVWLLSHEAFFPVSFLPSRRSSGKKRQMRLGAEQLLLNQCRRRGPLLRGGTQGQDGERSHFALQQSLPF